MSERIEQLARRRETLLARSEHERRQFATSANALEAEVQSIDRGVTRIRDLAKPAVLIAGMASLLYFGRGKGFRVLTRGYLIYSAWRRLFSRR